MAEEEPTTEQLAAIAAENQEEESTLSYKAPAQKSLVEIEELDKDDESLRKYKEVLLGNRIKVTDPNVPNVQVTSLTLVCASAPYPLVLDLTGDIDNFKKNPFVLKEGVEYKIKICFKVNREIVSGLKYIQISSRKGVRNQIQKPEGTYLWVQGQLPCPVIRILDKLPYNKIDFDKAEYMVGSYGPRDTEYEFLTTQEEAPKGVLVRGSYLIKSLFTDDDRFNHLSWEWCLNIKKDWKD